MNKKEIMKLQMRRQELNRLLTTPFRPSVTDTVEGRDLWLELLSINDILNRIGK